MTEFSRSFFREAECGEKTSECHSVPIVSGQLHGSQRPGVSTRTKPMDPEGACE